MNFFDHKDLRNHLLQLCPKVVKHPVYGLQLNLITNSSLVFCYYEPEYQLVKWMAAGLRSAVQPPSGTGKFLSRYAYSEASRSGSVSSLPSRTHIFCEAHGSGGWLY
jgi:hypothetical protein